jgi:histone-lysine N-methyltransferase SETMAR
VFWDSEGVIHVDFLPHGVTINTQHYRNFLRSDVRQAIQKKRSGKPSKITILLHDSAPPHTADLMKATLATMGWEIMNHPPHIPDLAPSDFSFVWTDEDALRRTEISN